MRNLVQQRRVKRQGGSMATVLCLIAVTLGSLWLCDCQRQGNAPGVVPMIGVANAQTPVGNLDIKGITATTCKLSHVTNNTDAEFLGSLALKARTRHTLSDDEVHAYARRLRQGALIKDKDHTEVFAIIFLRAMDGLQALSRHGTDEYIGAISPFAKVDGPYVPEASVDAVLGLHDRRVLTIVSTALSTSKQSLARSQDVKEKKILRDNVAWLQSIVQSLRKRKY